MACPNAVGYIHINVRIILNDRPQKFEFDSPPLATWRSYTHLCPANPQPIALQGSVNSSIATTAVLNH